MDRHTRQTRLVEVGAAGKARIAGATVAVAGQGLAAEVAARYLAGAGVGALRVGHPSVASAAQAVEPSIAVSVDPSLAEASASAGSDSLRSFTDPAARAVAEGALQALRALCEALAAGAA